MISAVVLTKNNEGIISQCLESVSWCDEVIIIDDFSIDKTVEIARKMGAEVFQRKLTNDFSKQRNFGLKKTSGEWILFIDSDEKVTGELAKEIKAKIRRKDVSGYIFKRQDLFMGKKLVGGEWGNTNILRLARAGSGKWERRVHEVWKVKGKVQGLSSPLPHSPQQTLSSFLRKINFYSTLHAKSNQDEGKKSSVVKIVFFPVFKFIGNFIFKRGYLDGSRGFTMAFFMSFHSFLAWSKLWLEQQKTD